MDQPEWMTLAWKEMGEREIRGNKDNPAIMKLFKDAGHRGIRHDEVPWCAAYVGACLERAGLKSTRSLMARSYLKWGVELKEPRLGAIAVLRRGKNPVYGHVGFVVRATRGSLYLLGGNQSDQVNVKRFSKSRLLAFRWPHVDGEEGKPEPGVIVADAVLSGMAVFERALDHVLKMEGGFDNDPHDPGGATNFGITIGTFAREKGVKLTAWNRSRLTLQLKRISPGVVRKIYLDRYWKRAQCEQFVPALALMHFDCAVNQGRGRAARLLQMAVGADVDGEIGPLTIAAARKGTMVETIERYGDLRRRHYRGLGHFWRFGRGWLRRVDKTEALCLVLLDDARTSLPHVLEDLTTHKEMDEMQRKEKGTTMPETGSSKTKSKWWGESMTIWGALLTALSTVLPVLGPLIGLDVTVDMVKQLGEQLMQLFAALGGVIGLVMTIYGRTRATTRLVRREVRLMM